ncbi:hypothetical protein C0995_006460 [Termitomyces sp. Mi166|nr:hypothetical protein C0995_006460 [Termitomyces sp. Mi166\
MIKAVSGMDNDQAPHIIYLLDHFTIHGPNGEHSVLVTDVVVPISSIRVSKGSLLWRKSLALGLAKGVAKLHDAGIVHGDLHLGNMGLAFPELDGQDPFDVVQELCPHDLTVVLSFSSDDQTSSLPPYIITPCGVAKYHNMVTRSALPRTLPQTKIFDFGAAHEVGTSISNFHCRTAVCAPEVVFAMVIEEIKDPLVDPPADIWALGCCIYELVTGSSLFYRVSGHGLASRMVSMASSLPPKWQDWCATLPNPPQVSKDTSNLWWASEWRFIRSRCDDDAEADALVALLKKLLVLDPMARPTAIEVLDDPWLLHAATMTE